MSDRKPLAAAGPLRMNSRLRETNDRIFVALDIPGAVRASMHRFVEGLQAAAPDLRWAGPESFHVTLKFVGERPAAIVEQVKHALSQVKAAPFEIGFRGYGFFPDAKSPRVFWIRVDAPLQLFKLAGEIDMAMSALRIPKEDQVLRPHLTLARTSSGSPRRHPADGPNLRFQALREKLEAQPAPDFGKMVVREFFLYRSQLSPGGSSYTKLAQFSLQGVR
jgi:RNA 2',3'-cyclic 3'-phosphodiesterase